MAKVRADLVGVTLAHHNGAEVKVLKAGDTVPDGYTIGGHLLDGDAGSAGDGQGSTEPPRSGAGSGKDEWAAYADSIGVEYPDDAKRDDIVAAVDAAKAA